MPAPERPQPYTNQPLALNVPKGIVGYYTDLEIDALLAGLGTGTGTVDLSAYATTAYVDGKIATVYTKAEVDALLATLASGGTIDLSGYATQQELADAVEAKADLDNPNQTITAGRLNLSTVGYIKYGDVGTLYLQTDGKDYQLVSIHDGDSGRVEHIYATKEDLKPYAELLNTAVTQELLDKYAKDILLFVDLKADKATTYTKAEVDAAIAAIQPGQPSVVDLSDYATNEYVDSTKQEILTAATVAFQERYTKQESDGLFVKKEDMVAPPSLDGYATEQYVDDSIARIPATDLSNHYTKTEVDQALANAATGGTVDLSAYAKKQDNTQDLLSKTLVTQAIGFGDAALPPVAITYTDTGEGYGERLVITKGLVNDYLVLKTDLDPFNALLPRMEALEGKAAPSVDMSGYAEKADTYTKSEADALFKSPDLTAYAKTEWVAAWVEANAYKKSETYTRSEVDAKIPSLGGYATVADVATFVNNGFVAKADAYTKTECDTKFLTLVDVNGVYAFASETYKKSETYTKAEVETRLLEVPSPMKYLQWGGVFQKVPVGSANKDKWIAAGLVPSIQIVKGKHYRLEMTLQLGSVNSDYQMAWVGFRFNYRAINELPCTKAPLVNIGGFGTTTVLRDRPQIKTSPAATTTPTRADRFRLSVVDDWASASDLIEYAVEFEADRDIPNANFVPEVCVGGTWGTWPADVTGIVAVFRQMD